MLHKAEKYVYTRLFAQHCYKVKKLSITEKEFIEHNW